MAKYSNASAVITLGAEFRDRCFVEQRSILTDDVIWTPEHFEELIQNYVENPDHSNRAFDVKIKDQLGPASSKAKQLFAELYVLNFLIVGNVLPETKISKVNAILQLCDPPIELTDVIVEVFQNGGVVNGGQGYNTRRFHQFWYLVRLGRAFSALSTAERKAAMASTDAIEDTLYDLIEFSDAQMQKALCYLFDPENHEAVISQQHLDKITTHFDSLLTEEQLRYRPQRRAAEIKSILQEQRGPDWHLYIDREEWDSEFGDGAPEPVSANDTPNDQLESLEVSPLPQFEVGVAEELLLDQKWLERFHRVLSERRQVILQGPPGTGKTFLARRLAHKLTNSDDRTVLVQFHPAYAYEDFFEGFRPVPDPSGGTSLQLRKGPLRRLADAAEESPEKSFVLVIDEINRGNLARIFGELYFLLEYREHTAELMYSQEKFSLPKNLYIIGTMNTADRSIALVDSAMRRRFAFFNLRPDQEPTSEFLAKWCHRRGVSTETVEIWRELNRQIGKSEQMIGPSYFMRESVYHENGLAEMWETDVLPQLEETFYGDREQVHKRFSLDVITRLAAGRAEA